MALGPDARGKYSESDAAAFAELAIDHAIRWTEYESVVVPWGDQYGLTPEQWSKVVRPKYIAAGWVRVEWVVHHLGAGTVNQFIHLDARDKPMRPS